MQELSKYWRLVDTHGTIETYERQLPHGVLVLVRSTCGLGDVVGVSIVFVPAAPPPGAERP